jgi:hypothetical protein
MSPPSKELAKQPTQQMTWAMFTQLPWRARGIVGGSLEDSRTGPNTVEARNQPQRTDLLKFGPTGHVNPFVDIETISL